MFIADEVVSKLLYHIVTKEVTGFILQGLCASCNITNDASKEPAMKA